MVDIKVGSLIGVTLPARADVLAAYARVGPKAADVASVGESLMIRLLDMLGDDGKSFSEVMRQETLDISTTVSPYDLRLSCESTDHPGKNVRLTLTVTYVVCYRHDVYRVGGRIGNSAVEVICDYKHRTATLAVVV